MQKIFTFLTLCIFLQQNIYAQTVGLLLSDSAAYNGYTLFAPANTTNTYLIDNCGLVVKEWKQSNDFPGASAYLLENGNLLRTARIGSNFSAGGTGGRLQIFNWEDTTIWQYDYSDPNYHHHHDVAPMPNGNILVMAWDRKTKLEATVAGRDTNFISNEVWSERIVEIKPISSNSAEIVWEWYLWDHLIQDFDSTRSNYGVVADHPELMDVNAALNPTGDNKDWIHLNSIQYNENLDQIILSSRHLNEIYIIDHSTTTAEAATHQGGNAGKGGDILFRWGNPLMYQRGTIDDQQFFGQHDARWIPDGHPQAGNIMVFNNGLGRPGGSYSSVDVIVPPLDANNTYTIGADTPFGPEDLLWTYEYDPPQEMYSPNISGAQRLPNGNTLVCEGRRGNFYEVTLDGDIIWHYKMPIGSNGPVAQGTILTNASIFRATRYGTDYPAFDGKDLTPGLPVELDPIPSDCKITAPPVSTSTVAQLQGVKINNNPFTEYLSISNLTDEVITIRVFDVVGRLLAALDSADETIRLPASDWERGFYVVHISNRDRSQFFVQKIIRE
ncbi:MAG: aryl-sulfate sulfotransferase [Bacteroidota bacterium]